jgi:hypothetical protein
VGEVVALHGQTVGQLLEQLNKMHAEGNLTSLAAVGTTRDNDVCTGISTMVIERAVYMADVLLQEARTSARD